MNKKKGIGNAVFLLLIFIITIYMIFRGQDLKALLAYIKTADWRYWIVSVVCVIGFIAGESIVIFYMMSTIGYHLNFVHCLLYSFVGFFFSCVTPGATGGQPMQLYYMRKDNIPVSVGTLVLMIVTITYKMVLVVLGIFLLLFKPHGIIEYLEPVMGWCYLGIALNIFAVGSMIVLVFHSSLAKKIVQIIVRILRHFKIFKHPEKVEIRVERSMAQYADVAGYFKTHHMVIVNVFLITILQRICLFLVTYLTCMSFGFTKYSIISIVSLQGMIAVAVDMLPLPGGMGISEKLFMMIFNPLFGNSALALMIISRGLSYYTELLISAVMTIVAHFTIRGIKK